MAIFNLGSINADHFYTVPHLPEPGETLAATAHSIGLGGKGANQSVAAARAGANVTHIGAVGEDGLWAIERLNAYGVGTDRIAVLPEVPTAHAIINVDQAGENAIVIFSGANAEQDEARIDAALGTAQTGDILLLQNETTHQIRAAKLAHARGMKVLYSAAPFDIEAVRAVLPFVDLLLMNEVEQRQLLAELEPDIPLPPRVITMGGKGADYIDQDRHDHVASHKVTPVDTTGAGDTFAGFLAAGLDRGEDIISAMTLASKAAALKITRKGTADAIPSLVEVQGFQ